MTRARGPATPTAFVPPDDAGPLPPIVEDGRDGSVGTREPGFAALDRDALLAFLRENLRVTIYTDAALYGRDLTVRLTLSGEEISSDRTFIPDP